MVDDVIRGSLDYLPRQLCLRSTIWNYIDLFPSMEYEREVKGKNPWNPIILI